MAKRHGNPVYYYAFKEKKISRLTNAISGIDRFVMAGSMDSFHEHFDPFFSLGVYLNAPSRLRVERVHQREYKRFGSRILENGDMYEKHQRFLADTAAYDAGGGSTSITLHNNWAESLNCPVIRLDGSKEFSTNLPVIISTYLKCAPF